MVLSASRQVVRRPIPMFDLRGALRQAGAAAHARLEEMHARGQYVLGEQTSAFEREFAQAMGGVAAIGIGSGTSALELSLRDAGIGTYGRWGSDCDVIVPAMTSMFTALAVLATGARIRVADVSPDDLLLTAETAERAFTPSTRAVIAVHLYGQPCNLPELSSLSKARGVALIQDACQAHGAFHRGVPLSHFSPYCAYSFYPTKNLGCLGDGGAVVTSDPEVAARLRQLRDGGRLGDQLCRIPAVNSRLDEMHACYLRAFLPHLPEWNARRRQLAARYAQHLSGSALPRLLLSNGDSVQHLCVARCPRRDELRAFLLGEGVHTGIHYPVPIHEQPGLLPYMTWRDLPENAARASREILSLPLGPHLSEAHVDSVADLIREFA